MPYSMSTVEVRVKVPPGHFRLNITQMVEDMVVESGVVEGYALVQTKHTTTALVASIVQEDEKCLMNDVVRFLDKLVPDVYYEHDDFSVRTENIGPNEPRNARAHLKAALLSNSPSVMLVVRNGQLTRGTWQSILFFDFDPDNRPYRTLVIQVAGITK